VVEVPEQPATTSGAEQAGAAPGDGVTPAEAAAADGVTPGGDASNGAAPAGSSASAAPAGSAERVDPANSSDGAPGDSEVLEGELLEGELLAPEAGADGGEPATEQAASSGGKPSSGGDTAGEAAKALATELASLRTTLDERTADLLRMTAEYANYRKRVDRDRALAAEQATGVVLAALLPVLDDLDRARDHGDLVGPFVAVAEQLNAALNKFGLTGFGTKGDPFDPKLHEAVAHLTSAEVTEPTCIDVLRRGYLLGEKLLRPAMVAVADPD
jgi:molecular chaperone GrpE